jgi:large subunit ribosomal protein L21
MKKAVIASGSKQYLVSENETIEVEKFKDNKPDFSVLLLIEDDTVSVGSPSLEAVSVEAEIIEQIVKAKKVTSIRYKAKKRVHKTQGHRQSLTSVKIKKITKK